MRPGNFRVWRDSMSTPDYISNPDQDIEGHRMTIGRRLPLARNYKLGVRLVSVALGGLAFGLLMVMATLWLSWELEGAAAAVNDAGSLRVQSVQISQTLANPNARAEELSLRVRMFQETLDKLSQGDPQRPLHLPKAGPVIAQFGQVTAGWQAQLMPWIELWLESSERRAVAAEGYREQIPAFIRQADRLVGLIEKHNARDTAFLRGSQIALMILMLVGCVGFVYLLYGWVIRPVEALHRGINRIAGRDFSYRVPVEGNDELGELAYGFNDMAEQLGHLYSELEARVNEKTRRLELQNREMTTLYEFSAYLSEPRGIEERCEGFLDRLIGFFGADGGTVRIYDPRQNNYHLVVHRGFSPEFVREEQCLKGGDCLCGQAAEQGIMIVQDFRELNRDFVPRCQKEGFTSIASAQIRHAGTLLGSYTLHFLHPRVLSVTEKRLFDTVGQHLGVAIENNRLLARTRELAIAEERNLMAQGLHDSIAQGLNFMKLQVQMLEDSMQRGQTQEMRDVIDLIQLGLRESYSNVRELLTNFRIKLEEGDIVDALSTAARRFEQQTGIHTKVTIDNTGAPLPPEQQLQLLFIVQEALSNVRKHAGAQKVRIFFANARDVVLSVTDDGHGFSLDAPHLSNGEHIGLKIMHERAAGMNARLDVTSAPGQGTSVELILTHEARQTA